MPPAWHAGGDGMLAAAVIAVFMIRGTKDELLPPRATQEEPVLVGAH